MHLQDVPIGAKARLKVSPEISYYGYVDEYCGFKTFICSTFKVRQDVSGLFLKNADSPYDIAPFVITNFFHVQPSSPFKHS